MARTGRPKKNGADSLSVHLATRITPSLDFQVKSYCKENSLALSDFIRVALIAALRDANYHK